MELILVAIVALVVLAGVDSDLWPRRAATSRRSRRMAHRPRRATTRSSGHREPTLQRPTLGYPGASTQLCSAPRWWWE